MRLFPLFGLVLSVIAGCASNLHAEQLRTGPLNLEEFGRFIDDEEDPETLACLRDAILTKSAEIGDPEFVDDEELGLVPVGRTPPSAAQRRKAAALSIYMDANSRCQAEEVN